MKNDTLTGEIYYLLFKKNTTGINASGRYFGLDVSCVIHSFCKFENIENYIFLSNQGSKYELSPSNSSMNSMQAGDIWKVEVEFHPLF